MALAPAARGLGASPWQTFRRVTLPLLAPGLAIAVQLTLAWALGAFIGPLLLGSPAIDAGNPNGCTDGNGNLLKTDQRGYPRPDKQSGRCDIGAFERQKD